MRQRWKSSAFWQRVRNTMYHAQAVEVKEATKEDLEVQAERASATVGPRMGGVFHYLKYSSPTGASLIAHIALTGVHRILKGHHLSQGN